MDELELGLCQCSHDLGVHFTDGTCAVCGSREPCPGVARIRQYILRQLEPAPARIRGAVHRPI